MTTKEMLNILDEKTKLTKELAEKLDKLTDLEIQEKSERTTLMNGDWTTKITGKVTEKAKASYCDEQLQDKTIEIKWLENDIGKLKRQIELCNDKLSILKYVIRESEL